MQSYNEAKNKPGFNIIEWFRTLLARKGKIRNEIIRKIDIFNELSDKMIEKDGQDND